MNWVWVRFVANLHSCTDLPLGSATVRWRHCRAYAHKPSSGSAAHKNLAETQGVDKDHPTNSISKVFFDSCPDIAHLEDRSDNPAA